MTVRQRAVLAFLHDTMARTGKCPSLDELGAQLGIKAPAVCRMLKRLEAEGFIRRNGRQRQLEVVQFSTFNNLLFNEIAWCQANPERVRAMMAIAGAYIS